MEDILMRKVVYENQICEVLNEMYDQLEMIDLAMVEVLEDSITNDEEDVNDLLLLEELRRATIIEDEDQLIQTLNKLYQSLQDTHVIRNQPFVTISGSNRVTQENFHLKFPPDVCKSLFRFEGGDILKLIEVLKIPDHLNFDSYRTTSLESLLLLLRRLSSHCRYCDLAMEFDLRPQFQSQIFNGLIVLLFRKFGNHVRTIDNQWVSGQAMLEVYAEALQSKGCPLLNCVGWADGTHVAVCRPGGGLQQAIYCGHHKVHCFKALGILTPSGLLAAFGPFDGSTHDAMAGDIVGLDMLVQEHMTHDDVEYNLFLDAGYPIGRATITPYRRIRGQSQDELEWNRLMSRQRIAVEWGFAKLKNLFKMLTFKSNLKVRLSPVSMYFFVAIHLMNLHTCFYGSQIATYFGINQPTVELYMGADGTP